MQNHPDDAQKAFENALPFLLNAGNFLGAVADLFYQARLAFYTGHSDSAEILCQQWKKKFIEIAGAADLTSQSAMEIPAARGLDVVQSILLIERGQNEEAERLLVRTLEQLGWGSWMELHGFIELAHLRHRQGNSAGAQEILMRMSRLGPQHAACAEALDVLFSVNKSVNDPQVRARAETWTKKYYPDPNFLFALGIGPYHCDTEYFCNLAWARVQIALGHFLDASIFIGPALRSASECGLVFRVAELSILQALLLNSQGDSLSALDVLGGALEIAEKCGYTRFFDDGPELDKLLQQAAERKIHAQYARQLLASFRSIRDNGKVAGAGRQGENRASRPG